MLNALPFDPKPPPTRGDWLRIDDSPDPLWLVCANGSTVDMLLVTEQINKWAPITHITQAKRRVTCKVTCTTRFEAAQRGALALARSLSFAGRSVEAMDDELDYEEDDSVYQQQQQQAPNRTTSTSTSGMTRAE